jgi:hypothetical protein
MAETLVPGKATTNMQISIVGDLPKQSAENCDVHWRISTQNTFCVLTCLQHNVWIQCWCGSSVAQCGSTAELQSVDLMLPSVDPVLAA